MPAKYPEVCQRFKMFITKHIGNQYDAANEIGTSTRHISEACRAIVDVTADDMIQLMEKYNLNVVWLLTGKGEDVK